MQQLESALRAYSRNGHADPDDEQITDLLPIVRHLVQRAAINLPRHYDLEFLTSAGVLALVEAVRTFDPTRGALLKTYAYAKIRGAILDELRASYLVSGTVRRKVSELTQAYNRLSQNLEHAPSARELARYLNTSEQEVDERFQLSKLLAFMSTEDHETGVPEGGRNLFDVMAGLDGGDDTPLGQIELADRKRLLADAIRDLPERERLVIALHYYEHLMLREIGLVLNVSESRVCQIHTAALLKLRKQLCPLGE
jgi:RNA polymerase sigma factor for flagellar operon FliA